MCGCRACRRGSAGRRSPRWPLQVGERLTMALGPFAAGPDQIAGLKGSFTPIIRLLIAAEAAKAGMRGEQFQLNLIEDTPDGGVDAALNRANATAWLPPGDSVWQFKRSDLPPAACSKELKGAGWAQDRIRDGATYRLVIGHALTPQKLGKRRDALRLAAEELGLEFQDDTFEVIDANQLATWITEFPSIAVHEALGGPGNIAVTIERWAASNRLQEIWVPCPTRQAVVDAVSRLGAGELRDLRLEGDSGVGKTRLVLETLVVSEAAPLVAYVARDDYLNADLVHFLTAPGRAVVLVVDDCERGWHKTLVGEMSVDSDVRLVTIGPADNSVLLDAPRHHVDGAEPSELEDVLKENMATLWPEARRVVSENSLGNIRLALMLAQKLRDAEASEAANLLATGETKAFITALVGDHIDFFLASTLALIERVGWLRERRVELDVLAEFAGRSVEDFEATRRLMEQRGLLVRQGRYMSVAPQPLAVVLAAEAWSREGDRILAELAPRLDRDAQLSLFRRVADLGRFAPVQQVLANLMSHAGPFGSLDAIEANESAAFLTQVAIVMPDATARHLHRLVHEESIERLRTYERSRRDLVWALEKLAWHTSTFELAADTLLRLSLAENETWANNATGTWLALFGIALPATAAAPAARLMYLRERAKAEDPDTRRLVATACAAAMHPHESVTVSGELQGGAVVEPRGSVKTYQEAGDLRKDHVTLLEQLRHDADPRVSEAALGGLLAGLHPFIDDPFVGPTLADVFASFDGEALGRLRREIEQLRRLLIHHQNATLTAALDALVARLPPADVLTRIRLLLDVDPWSFDHDNRKPELDAALDEACDAGVLQQVLAWLETPELAGAWHLGRALGESHRGLDDPLATLTHYVSRNMAAVAGFLTARVDAGDGAAFDDFLDGTARGLDDRLRLSLTARGPVTLAARRRILGLIPQLPVAEGVTRLFGWQRDSAEFADAWLEHWIGRVETQDDYNALVDWVNLVNHPNLDLHGHFEAHIDMLLALRLSFPNMANERWDWGKLAARRVETKPTEVAELILRLISHGDQLLIDASDDEARVLIRAGQLAPGPVWALVGERLDDSDWRLVMSTRGWITHAFPLETLAAWVGDSLDRARRLASIADVGGSEPTDVTRWLLDRFGDDDEVGGGLAAEFSSGAWTGNWSDRVSKQIAQLEGWLANESEPARVRQWALRMIDGLRREHAEALQREAERDFG